MTRKQPKEKGMDPGEQTTGTRDEHYNLISVLYHALHGAENCEVYALDAEAAGDERLAAFFREAQVVQSRMAEQAKEILGIGGVVPGAGGVPAGGDVVESDVSRTPPRDVAPSSVPGEAPPGPSEPPSTEVPVEAPPPGEERPERRGMAPSTDTPREAPPPGEERPERRTP